MLRPESAYFFLLASLVSPRRNAIIPRVSLAQVVSSSLTPSYSNFILRSVILATTSKAISFELQVKIAN